MNTQQLREKWARGFHDIYERLAPRFGYKTREDTKEFDPESKNGKLMMAVCGDVIELVIRERETNIGKLLEYILKESRGGCGICGGNLVEIRGHYVGDPKRKVCPTCLKEIIEDTISNLYPNNQPSSSSQEIRRYGHH